MNRIITLVAATLLICSSASAQVVDIDPVFATRTSQATITYNTANGNGELLGVTPVYVHTGVITSLSTSASDWKYVQTTWGSTAADHQMTPVGLNTFEFDFNGETLEDYYGVPQGEEILQLAFVFRNGTGSLVGRDTDGGDIYVEIFGAGFATSITSPAGSPLLYELGETFDVTGQASDPATLTLWEGSNQLATAINTTTISHTVNTNTLGVGDFELILEATTGSETDYDTIQVVVRPPVTIADAPGGTIDGINYIDDNTVILQLHAPFKDFVFAIGDFSDWNLSTDYYMNKTTDGQRWWIQLDNLVAGQEYRFQYWIDDELMKIADIYSEKILDGWNDQWIEATTYPNLTPYPTGLTSEPVSVFQTAQQPYQWQNTNWTRPDRSELVVYELLIRDFTEDHSWAGLMDTLDYLENLGVNCIEFMPVNEFEGNNSWGYNPSFYFAPDKYYGPAEDMKAFIDECHGRGIAVILDIALNHSFGQNPQVRMYFDPSAGDFGQPTAQNPWFFQTARHDFNVGYDYNHDSPDVEAFTDRVVAHWVENYNVDGYRFDLSKGFTSNNTLGNIGAWNAYDQSRVDNWFRIKGELDQIDNGLYLVLEHFSDNSEETALANGGFMFWGNGNHDYTEAAMGYSADLNWGSNYQARGWNDPHLLSFMESHDEERMIYKNLNFGASNGNYNTTELNTALARAELSASMFFTVPGPKMIWQFGELGYDYSINYCSDGTIDPNCRTDAKPIRWDYLQNANRRHVYDVFAALANLKTTYNVFNTTNYTADLGGFGKRVLLYDNQMDVVANGNFGTSQLDMVPGFSGTGTWYEYFSGEELEVTDINATYTFAPGEYRLWTSEYIEPFNTDTGVGIEDLLGLSESASNAYPNPFRDNTTITVSGVDAAYVTMEVYDIYGKQVRTMNQPTNGNGEVQFQWDGAAAGSTLPAGVYQYRVVANDAVISTGRVMKTN